MLFLSTQISMNTNMNNRNSKFYAKISDIEVSQVVIVLFFSTEISIEVLRWIIAILNFSTEMSDIEQSRVILVLYFNTKISIVIIHLNTSILIVVLKKKMTITRLTSISLFSV